MNQTFNGKPPYQTTVWESRYSAVKQKDHDYRSEFSRDLSRLLHSQAFRRLQRKTQVIPPSEGDYHRTRLTHSLETAQIGRGIVCFLNQTQSDERIVSILPQRDLIEAICLAHDLGHPPFGHGGEMGLNEVMKDEGGFEANAQSLRIMTKLGHYDQVPGMNLTRRMLLGILKYPALYDDCRSTAFERAHSGSQLPPKCVYNSEQDVLDYILAPLSDEDRQRLHVFAQPPSVQGHARTQYKSLDASIMECADDIAYATHDLEDSLELNLINAQQLDAYFDPLASSPNIQSVIDGIRQATLSHDKRDLHEHISALIHLFITHIEIACDEQFTEPLLHYNAVIRPPYSELLKACKKLVMDHVILSHRARISTFNGQCLVAGLFDVLSRYPQQLLPNHIGATWCTDTNQPRVIADYIAGMTDDYAIKRYKHFFVAGHRDWFD